MAKKAATSHMNQTERVAGTIFFIVYLLVLPLLANKLFGIVLGVPLCVTCHY